ncbi:hypothetical protein AGMMS49546_01280 [Spirochaetia bacterium]|nr:hypothetical protein AGMMS49546_01280 [Spirochaetia bacterium]
MELAVYNNILGGKYKLLRAESAPQALKLLNTAQVDLILLDIEMPGMSGFEFLHQIRKIPKLIDIPVIVVSSHSTEEFVTHSLTQGAGELIPKPVHPAHLLQRIKDALETPPKPGILAP